MTDDDHGDGAAVTDEDRNTYGALLDGAAERGLLGPDDYQTRLRQLAEATTTKELVAIVTDFPAFRGPAPGRGLPGGHGRAGIEGAASRTEGRRWVALVILVLAVVVALVVLGLAASHLHRSPPSSARLGTGRVAAVSGVSALRL
ncbi:MAG: DUF1707 domain-containing protein [Acidimicrobiales bacterium]|nr:DUF1707 domain-containing protein [Acidimicrobiales bacterium]